MKHLAALALVATAACGQAKPPERRQVRRIVATPTPVVTVPPSPVPTSRPTAVAVARHPRGDMQKPVSAPSGSVPDLIREVFGADAPKALAVAACESHFDPSAREGVHIGVFQINKNLHGWRVAKVGGTSLWDAATNVRVARHLQLEQGWRPWTCA